MSQNVIITKSVTMKHATDITETLPLSNLLISYTSSLNFDKTRQEQTA